MKRKTERRLSQTECAVCKHKNLCYSNEDWKADIVGPTKDDCDNFQNESK